MVELLQDVGTVPAWLDLLGLLDALFARCNSMFASPPPTFSPAATGVSTLFPVQAAVWRCTAGGASPAHDVCICAPTGSGKTLAYALPVLQVLAGRAVPCLRALVVLPTRDLAAQVFAVLARLCPALGLTAALAAGKAGLAAEAQVLAGGGIGAPAALPATCWSSCCWCWLCAS
jgi:hypothetical protein